MSTDELVIKFPPGSVIFKEGDAPDYAYLITEGRVEISVRRPDGRVILNSLGQHQLFGDLALMENSPRSATATTLVGCELMAVSQEQFVKKLDELDPFTRYWVLYLSDRIKDLSKRVRGS
jgi:CRP-like cAMP-binding protein